MAIHTINCSSTEDISISEMGRGVTTLVIIRAYISPAV